MKQSNEAAPPITVEQARRVKWTRQNPRPMGELLDEGYLTKKDLEWAAQRAFNEVQKQAAQVLLDGLNRTPVQVVDQPHVQSLPPELAHSAFPINLTMEQVRATEWPFSPYKGQPIGRLVDRQQLTLKDLGFAVEAAWDQRVRQASIALLLTRLNQVIQEPDPAAGLLHVISGGRSFAERRQIAWALLQGFISGVVLTIPVIYLLESIGRAVTSPAKPLSPAVFSPIVIVAIVVILSLMIAAAWLGLRLFYWGMDRIDKQIENHYKGQEGEERVVAAMHGALDGNWCLFRNVELPGRNKGDLDSVLVGPSGIWVIEIKTFSSEYRNIGEHWEYRTKSGWRLNKKSPSRQAADNAARLSSFLKADGIQQWITPVVIWANPEAKLQVENPSVAVWTLERLPDELGNIWQEESLPEPKRQQIVEKLTKICRAQQEARKSA